MPEKAVAQKPLINTDIHRDIIREYAASIGLKGVSLIAVDDTWSAMRLKLV
jgi:hypothetical protein